METVFFGTEQQIILEYLIGSLWGLNWKNVLLCARDTVKDYFRKNNVTQEGQTTWWVNSQTRGLDMAVNPNNGIDLTTCIKTFSQFHNSVLMNFYINDKNTCLNEYNNKFILEYNYPNTSIDFLALATVVHYGLRSL